MCPLQLAQRQERLLGRRRRGSCRTPCSVPGRTSSTQLPGLEQWPLPPPTPCPPAGSRHRASCKAPPPNSFPGHLRKQISSSSLGMKPLPPQCHPGSHNCGGVSSLGAQPLSRAGSSSVSVSSARKSPRQPLSTQFSVLPLIRQAIKLPPVESRAASA